MQLAGVRQERNKFPCSVQLYRLKRWMFFIKCSSASTNTSYFLNLKNSTLYEHGKAIVGRMRLWNSWINIDRVKKVWRRGERGLVRKWSSKIWARRIEPRYTLPPTIGTLLFQDNCVTISIWNFESFMSSLLNNIMYITYFEFN